MIPNAGHAFDLVEGCADRRLVEIFGAADPRIVDAACASEIRRPPFVLPDEH